MNDSGRTLRFSEIVYKRFDKEYWENYTLPQLLESRAARDSELQCVKESFKNKKDKIQEDFRQIIRIIGSEDFLKDFKCGKEYVFFPEQEDDIVELISRYKNSVGWKKGIRCVPQGGITNFVRVYRNCKDPKSMYEELQFAIETLIKLYNKIVTDEEKQNEFQTRILIKTSFTYLRVQRNLVNMIWELPELNENDVGDSKFGILLNDYEKFLEQSEKAFKDLVNSRKEEWSQEVEQRKKDFLKEREVNLLDNFFDEKHRKAFIFIEEIQKRGVDINQEFTLYDPNCKVTPREMTKENNNYEKERNRIMDIVKEVCDKYPEEFRCYMELYGELC